MWSSYSNKFLRRKPRFSLGKPVVRPPRPPRSFKKYSPEKLYKAVLKELQGATSVTAECVARALRVKPHLITQVYHKLNLLGAMGRRVNSWDWDGDWYASRYQVYPDKIEELLTKIEK